MLNGIGWERWAPVSIGLARRTARRGQSGEGMSMRGRYGLLAVAVLLVLAACGGDDDAGTSSAEALVGTWNGTEVEFQFDEDGSHGAFIDGVGQLEEGQYAVEAGVLTFRRDERSTFCGGTTGQYRLAFDGADTFSLELVEEGCDIGPANGAEDSNPYERSSG